MEIFKKNKYSDAYFKIIERARYRGLDKNKLDGYHEKHHILPRSLGGGDESGNLVLLTAKEHYVCHHLLTKFVVKEVGKMWNAFFLMHRDPANSGRRFFTSRGYEYSKVKMAQSMMGRRSWNKGVLATEEHKAKMSAAWNRDADRNVSREIYTFEHEDGTQFRGTRKEFCSMHGVHHKRVYTIVKGMAKATKGWRIVWEKDQTLTG